MTLFHQHVVPVAEEDPERPAFIFAEGECGYGGFARDVRRAASFLRTRGVRSGQRVLLRHPDLYMAWTTLLALDALGAVTCCVAPVGSLDNWVEWAEPDWVAVDDPTALPAFPRRLVLGQDWRGHAEAHLVPRAEDALSDRPQVLLVTSGTTGEPKRVMLTRAILQGRLSRSRETVEFTPPRPRSYLTVGPSSIGGLIGPLAVWGEGGSICCAQPLGGWVDMLNRHGLDVIALPPVAIQMIVRELDAGARLDKRPTVYAIGGTPPRRLVDACRARVSRHLIVTYGSTEAGGVAIGEIELLPDGAESAGRVSPWAEVEILDEAGRPAPPGQVGELRLRTDSMVDGYWRQQDEARFRDGWFHPGDYASLGADGSLRIHGRTDDLMHLGGHKLLPSVLEAVALERGLEEVAAFSVADADGLETPWLAYVALAGQALDEEALRSALRTAAGREVRLAACDTLPRNGLGKVDRRQLRAALSGGQATPGAPSAPTPTGTPRRRRAPRSRARL